MGRKLAWESLQPMERRVAHLHIAEASEDVIAYLTGMSQTNVINILRRPHVATYMMKLTALNDMAMAPALKLANEAIEEKAARAFDIECQAMERLFELDDKEDKRFVHAQMSAATIAQDVLDRAGNKAPTKIQQKIEHTVPPQTIEQLGRVIGEAFGSSTLIDITPEREELENDG